MRCGWFVVARSLTDGMLVNRAGRGDAIAFSQLVERHYQRVCGVAATLVSNGATAQDITQAAFARSCNVMASYRTAWDFYVGTYRQVILSCFAVARGSDEGGEDKDAIRARLAALPRLTCAALALRECAGFTYHQIAYILQCRVATVQRTLAVARTTLATSRLYHTGTGTDACGRGGA